MGFSSGKPILKYVPQPRESNVKKSDRRDSASVVALQSEVDAIVDKLNATLQKLRDAGILKS